MRNIMVNRFVAIDFETANADLASICQVGVVTFENGEVVESWGSLVNPEDYFDWINIDIHGIDQDTVKNAPTFGQIYELLKNRLHGQIVVSHTSFDRGALAQALSKYGLVQMDCTWLDSARVVRRTWEQWAQRGYGLGNICKELGIVFDAHDAVEDARAAGQVLLLAMDKTGLDLNGLLARVKQSIDPASNLPIVMHGDPHGPLFGEEVAFTGALIIPRREAAAMAAKVGCDVVANVKKSTTVLVVGDQDILKLAGHEKSIKHRKAEELIGKGQSIRVLRESDFLLLVNFV